MLYYYNKAEFSFINYNIFIILYFVFIHYNISLLLTKYILYICIFITNLLYVSHDICRMYELECLLPVPSIICFRQLGLLIAIDELIKNKIKNLRLNYRKILLLILWTSLYFYKILYIKVYFLFYLFYFILFYFIYFIYFILFYLFYLFKCMNKTNHFK
jgi:hypothetical protein